MSLPRHLLRTLIYFLLAVVIISAEKHYNGYKVYTVISTGNDTHYEALVELQNTQRKFDFWSFPSTRKPTDIMVAPQHVQELEEFLHARGIKYTVAIRDVQRAVEKQKRRLERQSEMNWNDYQRLSTIHEWMDSLAEYSPELAQITSIGKSAEGNDLKLIRISKRPEKNNPIIFIDGGIHAREWISPAVVTYIMGKLMSLSEEDNDLVENVDWHIIPVLNPDGYEFSHIEDRLWRKSRSNGSDPDCPGVDLNRNFDSNWGTIGSSDDPCEGTYAGSSPFSEPESNSTARYLTSIEDQLTVYLTFHSYAQLWLTPYGYKQELPENYDDMEELGNRATRAMAGVHGVDYQVGPSHQILYFLSGCSQDWARDSAGAKYSYTIELRDDGDEKFLLSPEYILPSGEEMWEAMKAVARYIHEKREVPQGSNNSTGIETVSGAPTSGEVVTVTVAAGDSEENLIPNT